MFYLPKLKFQNKSTTFPARAAGDFQIEISRIKNILRRKLKPSHFIRKYVYFAFKYTQSCDIHINDILGLEVFPKSSKFYLNFFNASFLFLLTEADNSCKRFKGLIFKM